MIEEVGSGSVYLGVIVITLFAALWLRKSKNKSRGISGKPFPKDEAKSRKERVQDRKN